MKRFIFLLLCITLLSSLSAQETKFKEYSYSEFFDLVANEKDSVFQLNDALIKYNEKTDSIFLFSKTISNSNEPVFESARKDTIHIYKQLRLNNVHFVIQSGEKYAGLYLIHFHKKVYIINSWNIILSNCIFDDEFYFSQNGIKLDLQELRSNMPDVFFVKNLFQKGVRTYSGNMLMTENANLRNSSDINFYNCTIYSLDKKFYGLHSIFSFINGISLNIVNTKFEGKGEVRILFQNGRYLSLKRNLFPEQIVQLTVNSDEDPAGTGLDISENEFENTVMCGISTFSDKLIIDYDQFKKGIVYYGSYFNMSDSIDNFRDNLYSQAMLDTYLNKFRVENSRAFREESKMLGQFYDKYKGEHDTENANKVYVDLKDLETQRLAYHYKTHPTFDTFFTLKINQFLKLFSAYGTKPSKAIIFSLYVILLFALIYLFFPNSWDSHGKHRIIHRYTFFMKYLNRNQGIHEVYLEEKEPELLAYENFRKMLKESEQTVPRFFVATALPLYKWALSGTKLTASLLSRFDVLKGTWQEVPPSHRWWKVILLVGAFLIAIAYDIIIKILNALMLSINTFTTLGFGEIPIKGLPRYLAIIQGFIGWFMLTIFSVSLISQLLN